MNHFTCRYCGSHLWWRLDRTTTAGWVIFFLLLVACFPLCWLGLLVTEEVAACRECGVRQ